MSDQRGMTLVELMVSLAIVMLIVATASAAYIKLLLSYKSHSSISESYMSNLTGLELLRYDIEMAGYGLPSNTTAIAYTEAASAHYGADANLPDPSTLNDTANPAPRAFVVAKSANANNSDILAIKSTLANLNTTSKKWSIVTSAPAASDASLTVGPKVKLWGVTALDPVMDFTTGDNFIVLDNNGVLQSVFGTWCFSFNASAPYTGYYKDATAIAPGAGADTVYYVYGLDNSAGSHVMPFNRVDYFLAPTANKSCADYPNAFALYRGVVNQADGSITSPAPVLIDCVKDFEVAFGVNPTGNQIVWQSDLNQAGVAMTAAQIQQNLRELRIYVIYQEGAGKLTPTPDFKFSGSFTPGTDIGLNLNGTWTPAGQDVYYHWKMAEMDVKPVNLLNLQAR